jgi:Sulfatase
MRSKILCAFKARRWRLAAAFALLVVTIPKAVYAQQQAKNPNILVTMTDDVGSQNVSAYHRGMMGGSTPNIDRIAKEGALFTDYYAQQSCTAGRAALWIRSAQTCRRWCHRGRIPPSSKQA